MELRAGFKRTEFGLIPNEWTIRSISELIESQAIYGHLDGNHGALYPRSNEFKSHGVPYVAANDFANGRVNFGTCKFLSSERAEKFKKGVAQNGDVLFAHNATVGPVALLETNLPYVILSTTATYFRCNPTVLSNLYLLGALQSPFFVNQYRAVMAQSTRYQVPITAQRKLSLVVPPLAEQNAIATTLSDVDALIAGLERLITKKRDLKQAAMQQLLTGQTRLPGFSGEWLYAPVHELEVRGLLKLSRGNVISKSDIASTPGEYPIYSSSIHNNGEFGRYGKYMFDEELITWSVDGGGNFFYRPAHKFSVTNVCGFMRAKTESLNHRFLTYQLQQQHRQKSFDYQTKAHPSVVRAEYVIAVPSLNEQTFIAKLLSDMDFEIGSLESRLAKTRELKQGMMQELLTGRTRLV